MKIWNTVEDVLADFEADRPKPPPKPVPAPEKPKVARLVNQKRSTKDVIDAATAHNDAMTERLEETMESRRQKQMAKELAEYNADPNWHRLVQWRLSVERAEERIRALHGEVPEKGWYSPIARFEREQRGR